ncbi:hypothetical protein MMAD_07360 [Mycolicibacterium madagascariense]|uniref:Uncharacterized protein n=1 Tax=Mycolicibacterium madagascariense TaxID=212765 RepID=A0A7I7XCT9_9MYCO|nr:hypothetical protein [Mycolicibacterium madagascariense]MCV7015006.1 hypothetical protein [Mycolicibacterium madagascariense]BBZ26441.1 hypothetical protein MMAD_07360 [Mycolicibacterium madagascariense]
MSRSSAAKKARRKRRLDARNEAWLPPEMHADVKGVARIADVVIPRGWVFDQDYSTERFVTWYYPPSGVDSGDESAEAVTRIWLEDPKAPRVLLVGSTAADDEVALTVEELFARLPEIEAYRVG